jgi:nucleotide-binding universal stress UspA family protein
MKQSIVVGVDGSSAGAAAVRWAASRAGRDGFPLELVHVIDDEWGAAGEANLAELHPRAFEFVASALSLAEEFAPLVPISTTVLVGDPMVELAERSRSAAMVVIGTHKTGFFHGRALGSRGLQLAAMAWSPVAVIPESSTSLRRGVVVGVDDTDAGRAAVEFGAIESVVSGDTLTLINSVDGQSKPPARAAERSTASIAAAAGVVGLVRTREVHRPAAEALIDAALLASILVIGSSRRRGSELSALGPVSHDVLMNISGPTIVVHGEMTIQPAGVVE